ncbi:MAG: hypothetical protein V4450_03955 [Bacteroidota bacterium]
MQGWFNYASTGLDKAIFFGYRNKGLPAGDQYTAILYRWALLYNQTRAN